VKLRFLVPTGVLIVSPVQAQSFDCRYAASPNEITICGDVRLGALDERMSRLYFRLRSRLFGPDGVRLERSQAAWLRARCGGNRFCLGSAHLDRIAELSP